MGIKKYELTFSATEKKNTKYKKKKKRRKKIPGNRPCLRPQL